MLLFSANPGHLPCTVLEFPLLAELLKLFLKNSWNELLLTLFTDLKLLHWKMKVFFRWDIEPEDQLTYTKQQISLISYLWRNILFSLLIMQCSIEEVLNRELIYSTTEVYKDSINLKPQGNVRIWNGNSILMSMIYSWHIQRSLLSEQFRKLYWFYLLHKNSLRWRRIQNLSSLKNSLKFN